MRAGIEREAGARGDIVEPAARGLKNHVVGIDHQRVVAATAFQMIGAAASIETFSNRRSPRPAWHRGTAEREAPTSGPSVPMMSAPAGAPKAIARLGCGSAAQLRPPLFPSARQIAAGE